MRMRVSRWSYRESVSAAGEGSYTFDRDIEGEHHFASLQLRAEPNGWYGQ